MLRRTIATIAATLFTLTAPAAAQPAASAPAPEPVEILPLAFSPEGLSGPGGDRLRAAMETAQFIALGEDHGFAGSPQLGAALAHDADAIAERQGATPLYHAVEVGPYTVHWVAARLESGGLDRLGAALTGRPWAMPFLSNVEDAALAAPFAAEGRLWGIDQEFVGAPSVLFEVLAARTRDAAMRKRLAGWREQDRAALSAGKFDAIMMATATEADFTALHAHFAHDPEALAIVDALAKSARIYRLNDSGRYLRNNEERAALMQGYFLTAYRAVPGPAPRVLFKMGGYHLGRGTTPTSIYDIGSLLPGIAAANGRTSLHIVYVPLAGAVRQVKPSSVGFTKAEPYADETVGPILDAAGLPREAIPADGHVLIPIAPLRHNLAGKKLRDLPVFSRFLLLGYDYLVTTRGAVAATHFEARSAPSPQE